MDEIRSAVLELPENDRASLARDILVSLEETSPEPDVEQAWQIQIESTEVEGWRVVMSTSLNMLENPEIREAMKRISVDEYHRLGRSGLIPEDTELLYGVLIQKMTKSPLHTWIVRQLADWLRLELPEGFDVRQEQPVTLEDSEPEPDVAVVRGIPADYRRAHPSTATFIVEVAIATVELDRQKAQAYAAAGVGEFWIIIPKKRSAEIYTEPSPSGYRRKQEIVSPQVIQSHQFPEIKLDLKRLFADVDTTEIG